MSGCDQEQRQSSDQDTAYAERFALLDTKTKVIAQRMMDRLNHALDAADAAAAAARQQEPCTAPTRGPGT